MGSGISVVKCNKTSMGKPKQLLASLLLLAVGTCYSSVNITSPKFEPGRAGRVIEGQFIVVFNTTEINKNVSARDEFAILLPEVEQSILNEFTEVIKAVTVTNITVAQLLILLNSDAVLYVEEDQMFQLETDQNNPPSWGLDRIDQENLPLDKNYHYDVNGTGVTIFIIDSGVRTTHQDFGGRATCGYTAYPKQGCEDKNGHGTHVAGTAAGSTYGVAKAANIVAVKVLGPDGSGSNTDVIAGVEYVVQQSSRLPGSKVVNMSIGGLFSRALNSAVNYAVNAGTFFAVAAGNEDINACLSSPAAAGNAMSVGASTKNDERAAFSNFGDCVDIFAPGEDITSAWISSDSDRNTISGTSMASPHVAGIAALYYHYNGGGSAEEIMRLMLDNAAADVLSNVKDSPNLLASTEPLATTLASIPASSNRSFAYEVAVVAFSLLSAFLV